MFSILAQYPILFTMNALFGILVFFIYYGKYDKSAIYWGASAFALAFTFFLVTIRGLIPDSLGIALPNFLGLYALFLQISSIQYLANRKRLQKGWSELLSLLHACVLVYLLSKGLKTYIAPYVGVVVGLVNLWAFWEIKKANQEIRNSFVLLMAYLFLATAFVWFSRILLSQFFGFNLLNDQNIANWLTMLAVTILILCRHITYLTIRLSLASEKLIKIKEQDFNQAISIEMNRTENANKKVVQFENQLLSSLGALALARDNETGNHIIRTQHYVRVLAQRLRLEGYYKDQLSDVSINALFKAAPLHDVGKIGIPDHILKKEGPFTEEEWETMKTHALIGESVLNTLDIERDGESDVIAKAILIAGGHHEKWDGTGYPRGLAGENIPLEARIMSLADMYDALVSERVYKDAWSHEQAVIEIATKRGTQFDPVIVDAFIAEQETFKEIADNYRDS